MNKPLVSLEQPVIAVMAVFGRDTEILVRAIAKPYTAEALRMALVECLG